MFVVNGGTLGIVGADLKSSGGRFTLWQCWWVGCGEWSCCLVGASGVVQVVVANGGIRVMVD